MKAFYNEKDLYLCRWLVNLANEDLIAGGEVWHGDIRGVRGEHLEPFSHCHFFAGIGAWSYALRLAGWPDEVPVWTGSCPCQPFSSVGKRRGIEDERHLWPEFFRLIQECRPAVIFGEQVASKDGLAWLDSVSADLEGEGYTFGASDLCAAGVGAPHVRQRIYFVAYAHGSMGDPNGEHEEEVSGSRQGEVSPAKRDGNFWDGHEWVLCHDQGGGVERWRPIEPGSFPLVDGVPSRVGRLRAYGNSIVAPLAAEFIRAVMDEIGLQQ